MISVRFLGVVRYGFRTDSVRFLGMVNPPSVRFPYRYGDAPRPISVHLYRYTNAIVSKVFKGLLVLWVDPLLFQWSKPGEART